MMIRKSCAIRGRSNGKWFESEHEQRLEIGSNKISNSITSVSKDSLIFELNDMAEKNENKSITDLTDMLKGKRYRIRKLTPRECFRLMGVDDSDIDKIQASGISKSSQYVLAGNSIVVDVLYHIFRKMFIEKEHEYKKGEQLSIF